MRKIKELISKHPVGAYGIIFGVLSLIGNIVWFLFTNMTHVYDIIHVIPVILIYEPIIEMLGGGMQSSLIFIPLAIIIDIIVGLIVGAIAYRLNKSRHGQGWIIGISFAVYWIIITFQWLPII